MIKQLQGVDIVKYIMAFAVVAIHCKGDYPEWFEWFIRQAVPFFFLTSGFLLAREMSDIDPGSRQTAFLKRRVGKIFRLFARWLAIYVPLACAGYIVAGTPLWKIPLLMILTSITMGEILYAWPLWFLYSLGIGTLAVCVIKSRPRLRPLIIGVIAVSYVLYSMEMSGALQLDGGFLKYLPVRAIGGGAYLLTGMLAYRFINALSRLPVAAACIAVSVILMYTRLPFNELFGGIGFFILAYRIPVRNHPALCMKLRAQSMWVYYLHMYPVFFLLRLPELRHEEVHFWASFALIMVLMAVIAAVLCRLGTRFAFLRQLIK